MVVRVDRLWPNSTIVCIASGPSLTKADCDLVRGRAKVIAINNNYEMAPWADVLYACDAKWWKWHRGAPEFNGLKYALQVGARAYSPQVQVLREGKTRGLADDPSMLNTGMNSGYQAINLAVHLGASRIVLLGYDMQNGPKRRVHWHPEHPERGGKAFHAWIAHFATLVDPLRTRGIEVVNATRRTALTCFPLVPLEQAICAEMAA